MKTAQYASCPALEKSEALRRLYADPFRGRRTSSVDGSETATDTSDSSDGDAHVTDHERMQVEAFFRGLKTQVYVCNSLVNLYVGSTSGDGEWNLQNTGIPVLILDSGETRSRSKRRIQIVLAERGTCFTLWRDTIDNLTSYREAGPAFHTMHLSSDHTCLIGLSFDSPSAATEMLEHVEELTSSPENISLSVPGRRKNKKSRRPSKPQPLPTKSHISQPCCFQHITNVDATDRARYFSLQTLVPHVEQENGTDL